MQKFGTLNDAIALAEFAHRNQFDKAGMPYIDHPKRVLAKVQAQGRLPYVQIAAILHDVTEDTPFTPEMLLALGFSEAAVELVRLLDRGASREAYNSFYRTGPMGISETDYYYERIRENPGAYAVKMADIDDNTEPWRLSYLSDATQKRLEKKYTHARLVLELGWQHAKNLTGPS